MCVCVCVCVCVLEYRIFIEYRNIGDIYIYPIYVHCTHKVITRNKMIQAHMII